MNPTVKTWITLDIKEYPAIKTSLAKSALLKSQEVVKSTVELLIKVKESIKEKSQPLKQTI